MRVGFGGRRCHGQTGRFTGVGCRRTSSATKLGRASSGGIGGSRDWRCSRPRRYEGPKSGREEESHEKAVSNIELTESYCPGTLSLR